MFTDSIDTNFERLKDLISALPPDAKHRARKACDAIDKEAHRQAAKHPKDIGTQLGVAFAAHMIAQRLIEQGKDPATENKVIQLLS